MEEFLQKLRKKVNVGLVGGSDLVKILEQLGGEHSIINIHDYMSKILSFFFLKYLINF